MSTIHDILYSRQSRPSLLQGLNGCRHSMYMGSGGFLHAVSLTCSRRRSQLTGFCSELLLPLLPFLSSVDMPCYSNLSSTVKPDGAGAGLQLSSKSPLTSLLQPFWSIHFSLWHTPYQGPQPTSWPQSVLH